VHENLYVAVRSGSRTTDARHHVLRRSLVVTQVALAYVLLTGAGLLLRSVDRLLATAPGFEPSPVLTLQVVATGRRYGSLAEVAQLYERALDAVRAVPGVVDAAFTSQLPLSGDTDSYGVVFESEQRADNGMASASALRYAVTPGWFGTTRIPLVEGRLRMGPAIGQPDGPWATVVGVVGDVKQTSLALDAPDAVYFTMGQWAWMDLVQSLVVRTAGDPASLTADIERAIWSVDPTPPLVRVATMSELVERSEGQRRFALVIFAAFGLASLLYGVTPLDFGTCGGTVALLLGVALLACGVPAARAARIDPAVTLRAE
jgi:putative ABC transport system permease protein